MSDTRYSEKPAYGFPQHITHNSYYEATAEDLIEAIQDCAADDLTARMAPNVKAHRKQVAKLTVEGFRELLKEVRVQWIKQQIEGLYEAIAIAGARHKEYQAELKKLGK